MLSHVAIEICMGLALIVVMVTSLQIGIALGRRHKCEAEIAAGQSGVIQGAILGLLALLLGFSFAGASDRYHDRQDLILREANAIRVAYMRADLLDEPYASRMRQALAEYLKHRVEVARAVEAGIPSDIEAQTQQLHQQMWQAARDGVRANRAVTDTVLDSVTDVMQLHTMRVHAGRNHLPLAVMILLIASSLLAMVSIGYGCGEVGHRRSLGITSMLAILVAAALWITIDLDYPRVGLVRLSHEPLEQLQLPPATP